MIKKTCLILTLVIFSFSYNLGYSNDISPSLKPLWENKDIHHQIEAKGVFYTDQYIYTGQGGPEGRISKVNINNGSVIWSYKNQSYQPSYPVSNGEIVVFGTYYAIPDEKEHVNQNYLIFLNDKNGEFIRKVPTGTIMSAVTFSDKMLFAGNNEGDFYGIDWKSGKFLWKTKLGHYFWSKPMIYGDLVLVGSYDGFLYALNQVTGEIAWKINLGGTINSNPIFLNDIMIVNIDAQLHSYTNYDSNKAQKILEIVNLKTRESIETYTTESQWKYKIIEDGNNVYFFDNMNLYSYNTKLTQLNWKINRTKEGLTPYPIIQNDSIILAMNYLGHHGEHKTSMVWIDKKTGEELMKSDAGGTGIRSDNYIQTDNLLVITGWKLRGFKLQ